MGSEREFPRPNGMMQKVQRWSHPFCTWTKARTRRSGPWIRCAAGSGMRACAFDPANGLPRLPHRFSRHRTGIHDDGIGQTCRQRLAANDLGFASVQAAAKGEDVYCHIYLLPYLFRGMGERRGEQCGIEACLVFEFDWAGHQHVIVALAPFYGEIAPRQRHRHRAAGSAQARRSNSGSTGGRAARLSKPRTALPGTNDDTIARAHLRERDVRPLRKHRVMLEQRPNLFEVMDIDVIDPENRMRVSHAQSRGRM